MTEPKREVVDLPTESDTRPRFLRLQLTNYLSYKSMSLDFGDFTALVGPNASGKSNAVNAIKLLHEIAVFGLPVAINRRGGFDQLRHRSNGRPYDPAIRLEFSLSDGKESFYELRLGAVRGGRYRVKLERARVWVGDASFGFESDGAQVALDENRTGKAFRYQVAPGQSALSGVGEASFLVALTLLRIVTVEVNPASVAALQEPSSTHEFESDGSNVATVLDNLDSHERRYLAERLAAIVPGILSVEPVRFADKQTMRFKQETKSGNRLFLAKQMSDGTLRALALLLAAQHQSGAGLLVIEEPEVAIHLGALRTLVELLQTQSNGSQVVITTHSADIVDALPIEALRVVWSEDDSSHIAPVSEHSRSVVRQGLMTSGDLLRADSLDPEFR